MHEVKTKLRTEFTAMLNKNLVSLEACVEARVNEVCQRTTSTLEELKSVVAAAHESQE